MASFETFVINLEDSVERLSRVSTALSAQGVTGFHRIPAIDGRRADPEDYPEYDHAGSLRIMGRGLHGGEVACFLSHLKALRSFVDSGAPYGLILEDDAAPEPDALARCNALVEWQDARDAADWYVMQIGNARAKYTSPVDEIGEGGARQTILRGHYFPMYATALIWSRAGAEFLLDDFSKIDCPWDNHLRRVMLRRDMGLVVLPALFRASGAESDIGKSQQTARRSRKNRARGYFWIRNRRQIVEKLKAGRNRRAWEKDHGASRESDQR